MRIFKRLAPDRPRSSTFAILARCLAAVATACIAMSANGLDASGERGPLHNARNLAEDPSNARVIVRYRSDSTLRQALAGRSGAPVQRDPQHASVLAARIRIPLSDGRVLGPHTQQIRGTGISSSQLARQLAGMPDVAWATVDGRRFAHAAPNDPYFGPGQAVITPTVGQWYLRAPDSTMVSAINALGAWNLSTGSPSVTVAILDTGVRKDHPDLAGKLYDGYDFLADSSSSNDGDGRDPDASDPGDFMVAGQCSVGSTADTSSWHGTQVAGIVGAATNNGIGIAGTGRDVMVLPVRVLGACGGYDADIIAAMRWAAGLTSDVGGGISVANAHPAKVINLNLGSSSACGQPYIDVVQELTAAGVTVVASAGNEAGFATDAPGNCPGVLAVGGLRHSGTKVGFSSLGPEVAISAPAGNCVNVGSNEPCLYPIMTTSNAGTTTPAASVYTDSFNYSLGTSFSAPQVSGTVGLMLTIHPTLTPEAIKAALQGSARAFPTAPDGSGVAQCHAPNSHEQYECVCTTSTCGAGMLDAAAAVAWVLPAPQAVVGVDTSVLQSTHRAALSGEGSLASGGRSIAHYQWSLLSGQQYANFLGTTASSTATLQFAGTGGAVDVQLEVTDSSGATATTHQRIEGPVDTPPASTGSSGSGGSASALFLAGLMLACLALWRLGKPR
jgi:serine protease